MSFDHNAAYNLSYNDEMRYFALAFDEACFVSRGAVGVCRWGANETTPRASKE